MVTIRRAKMDDIPLIMDFLDKHWKSGCILGTDREFFEWQFLDGDKLNFFIGIDDEEKKIYGTLGVVVYSDEKQPDASGCVWKALHSDIPMLGMKIGDYAYGEINSRYVIGPHITKRAQKIEVLNGGRVVPLEHFYRINPEIEEYKIAEINDKSVVPTDDSGYRLVKLENPEEMQEVIPEKRLLEHVPAKNYRYIKKRYFDHPVYKYEFLKIVKPDGSSDAVLVTRKAYHDEAACLKIVDFFGEASELSMITASLDEKLRIEKLEFVDVYSYGVEPEIYEKAGFKPVTKDCKDIVPNYFHPFTRQNVDLITAYRDIPGLRFFRGDGDQDRPG